MVIIFCITFYSPFSSSRLQIFIFFFNFFLSVKYFLCVLKKYIWQLDWLVEKNITYVKRKESMELNAGFKKFIDKKSFID